MSFVRERGGRFYLGYRDEHGKQVVRVYKQARNLTEAKRIAKELERKAERIRVGIEEARAADVTVAEAVKRYLGSLPPEYASRGALVSRFKRVTPHIGKMAVRRVTKADVLEVLARSADVSVQTREHIRVALQALYTFLIGAKLATDNPAKEVGKLAIPEREPLYFTKEELLRLFKEIPAHWRAPAMVALGTALRKSELLGLPKANVRLDEGVILIKRTLNSQTTKAKKDRRLPVPAWLAPVLERQLRAAPGPLLFPRPDGKPWSKSVKVHEIIRRAMNRAGIVEGYEVACKGRGHRKGCGFTESRATRGEPLCPKCGMTLRTYPQAKPLRWKELRSTFATHAAADTGDIRFVQAMLGHDDLNITVRKYSFALPSHLKTQVDRVDFAVRDLSVDFAQSSHPQTTQHNGGEAKTHESQRDETPDKTR